MQSDGGESRGAPAEAPRLSPEAIEKLEAKLQAAFQSVDDNHDGFLDLGELAAVLKIMDPDDPDRNKNLWHLMDKLDTSLPYGRIQWSEFRDYWIERGGMLQYGTFTDAKWHARLEEWSPRSSTVLSPDQAIRHHHYEGSQLLDVEEVPNEYRLLQKLGSGHYASVHLAENREGDRSAMKIFYKLRMKPKEVHSVIREANLMRHVSGHPHIVQIYDLIETRQRLLLMLEPVLGGHLYSVIAQKSTFTEGESCRIVTQMLDAIAFMHKNDIIHCDLKPENIMCTSKQGAFDIKITDFGLSKHLLDDRSSLSSFVGTPLYAAPEVHGPTDAVKRQVRGSGGTLTPYGPLVDVWSAGCMLFEMLTGKPPFHKATTLADLKRIIHSYEGILVAADPRRTRESAVARNMKAELMHAGVDPVGQDLLARLLNPRSSEQQNCPNSRITAEQALNHSWILEHSNSNRNLADQVRLLGITTSKRKLRRAVSKILFMRRIVGALRGSVGGAPLAREQSKHTKLSIKKGGDKDRGDKDKGCCCSIA